MEVVQKEEAIQRIACHQHHGLNVILSNSRDRRLQLTVQIGSRLLSGIGRWAVMLVLRLVV